MEHNKKGSLLITPNQPSFTGPFSIHELRILLRNTEAFADFNPNLALRIQHIGRFFFRMQITNTIISGFMHDNESLNSDMYAANPEKCPILPVLWSLYFCPPGPDLAVC